MLTHLFLVDQCWDPAVEQQVRSARAALPDDLPDGLPDDLPDGLPDDLPDYLPDGPLDSRARAVGLPDGPLDLDLDLDLR